MLMGIFFSTAPLLSQSDSITEVTFYYDAAGNRTERENTYYVVAYKSSVVSVEEEEIPSDEGLLVYPNPVSHTLFVTLNQEALETEDRKILIFDSLGKLVSQVLAPQEINEIDVSTLMNGTYILRLSYGSKHKEWIIIKT